MIGYNGKEKVSILGRNNMIIKSIDVMKRGFKMDVFISEETKAKLKGSKTEQNLKDAFSGQSMAQTK